MADQTPVSIEQNVIYSVFVRNHSPEGTFKKVEEDLDRIRSLGADILWLMPIYPTGKERRKGKDGSPYAIADYRAVDPSMGTMDDLRHLVQEAHERGMRVIVDIVFNHTSPDSVLAKEHPEWFYCTDHGKPASLVADWSDIIDLDYGNEELQDYLIETLKQYAGIVDGFRCDVASRIPVSFWKKARAACEEVNPNLFWLAESCHLPFIKFVRDHGRPGESDSALFEAFDVLYDYDAFPYMQEITEHGGPIQGWVDALIRQDATLPKNAVKLRYLENHDTDRIAQYVTDPLLWKNWTALQFTLKGIPLIYEGQELRIAHRPDIFTKDPIVWDADPEAGAWMARMARVHKNLFHPESVIEYEVDEEHHLLKIMRDGMTGYFLLGLPEDGSKTIDLHLSDGQYRDLFTAEDLHIDDHSLPIEAFPLLIEGEHFNRQVF